MAKTAPYPKSVIRAQVSPLRDEDEAQIIRAALVAREREAEAEAEAKTERSAKCA